MNQCIQLDDFERLLNFPKEFIVENLPAESFSKLNYARLTLPDRDKIIHKVLKTLDSDMLLISGKNDPYRWEKGWGEVLADVRQKGFSLDLLQPQYFYHDILRFNGDYIKVNSKSFEFDFYALIRRLIFKKYLATASSIVEFGCGTGTNLVLLAQLFPDKNLFGCDWAKPSQELLTIIAQELKAKIQGIQFNMLTLEGQEKLNIDKHTAVITMHAMEQLGASYQPMLDYLIAARPGICLHLEPILELYNPESLFDHLAIRYHEKRNYLQGLLTALKEQQAKNVIEIMDVRRLYFGSLFHEGYSLIVWRVNDK